MHYGRNVQDLSRLDILGAEIKQYMFEKSRVGSGESYKIFDYLHGAPEHIRRILIPIEIEGVRFYRYSKFEKELNIRIIFS